MSFVVSLSQIQAQSPLVLFTAFQIRNPISILRYNQCTASHDSEQVLFRKIDYVEVIYSLNILKFKNSNTNLWRYISIVFNA